MDAHEYPIRHFPPYEEGRKVHLAKVKTGPPQTYRVLGERCVVVAYHFDDSIPPQGRDRAHWRDPKACPYCVRGLRPRLKPLLACFDDRTAMHAILQLSTDCLRTNRDLQPMHRVYLRGRRITVRRSGLYITSPISAELSEPDPDGHSWPVGADELAVVARLWDVQEDVLVLVDEAR